MAPGPLAQVLRQLPTSDDPNFLSSVIPNADAGVYRLRDDWPWCSRSNFFTPVVDDPRTFGRIAAANAFSDLFAMGARPVTATEPGRLFQSAWNARSLSRFSRGDRRRSAKRAAVIIGGHTVDDDEPKYGLAVTGWSTRPGWSQPSAPVRRSAACDQAARPRGILTTCAQGEVLTEGGPA